MSAEGLCTKCSATQYCAEHKPEGQKLNAITDTVLAYRPKARSKPAVQRKRRKTILDNKRAAGAEVQVLSRQFSAK